MAKAPAKAKSKKRKFGVGGVTSVDPAWLSELLQAAPNARLVNPGAGGSGIGGLPTPVDASPKGGGALAKTGNRSVSKFNPKAQGSFGKSPLVPRWLKGANMATMALTPDASREAPDADKPKNYPGEGLQAPAKNTFVNAKDVGPPRPLGAANKAAASAVKTQPTRRANTARPTSSDSDDGFLADLKASAQKMRDTTADMADKTGRMKAAAEDLAGRF